jgi:hypothetical protein
MSHSSKSLHREDAHLLPGCSRCPFVQLVSAPQSGQKYSLGLIFLSYQVMFPPFFEDSSCAYAIQASTAGYTQKIHLGLAYFALQTALAASFHKSAAVATSLFSASFAEKNNMLHLAVSFF